MPMLNIWLILADTDSDIKIGVSLDLLHWIQSRDQGKILSIKNLYPSHEWFYTAYNNYYEND